MNLEKALLNSEIINIFAYTILYPLIALFTALKLAKFHFEKGIKEKYLLAKDQVAIDITNYTSIMLKSMWEIVNIDGWISSGNKNTELPQRRQQALVNFNKAIIDSYPSLGLMGLYYGTKIVEGISQLHSDLSEMVNNNNFKAFDDWANFRKTRILPILNKVHKELKYTVFDRPFWDLF